MKKSTLLPALTTCVCNTARHPYLWAVLVALSALAFGPSPAQAAVTEAWVQRYNNNKLMGKADDQAVKVVRDAAGDVIVTGFTDDGITGQDMLTIKYSGADGSVIWQKRYNGPANSDDFPNALAVDGSGNVVVTGYSLGSEGDDDGYTAKYAALDGALVWEKRYNGPANTADFPSTVAVDGSGNVVVTGSPSTVKYAAADGALLWEKRYDDGSGTPHVVAVDGSGNVVVTGRSASDYYTAKYAALDGALVWEKRYNGVGNRDDFATAVAVDSSGNVVVTGVSDSQNGDGYYNSDYYTAKYAATSGALLWEICYNGPGNGDDGVGTSRSLALGPNGMVAITGYSDGNPGQGNAYDYATVVYRENLPPVSIALVPTGIRVRFTGVPGQSYTIERAPAVTGPWTTLNTQTAPAPRLIEYLDVLPPPGQAFYRTVQP